MRFTRLHLSGLLLAFFAPVAAHAATYYVSPSGSDNASGAIGSPWATWNFAQTKVKGGDTVYFRGGKYAYTKGISTCASQTATIDGIQLNVSGSAGNTINYFAYAGEIPVFDFSGIKDSCRVKGVEVTGNYIYLKGLEIMGAPQNNNLNHESWAIWISGSNNTFEMLNLHDNMGPGLFIQRGANNLVLNCDSHDNYDPMTSNGAGQSADGFGCHVDRTTDTGNVFRGCRAWRNSDDGWDFIAADAPVTVEDSWTWNNGYRLVGTTLTNVPNGNGNGFKGGGYGEPPTSVPANPPSHTIRQCLSVANKASGFYANHEPVGDHWNNNTAYNNNPNYNMLGDPANCGILRNNIAVQGTATSNMGGSVDDQFNSWTSGFGVTASAADFQSTSLSGLDAPRQADGSLPEITNFHLVAGSDLINKGTNVGLPYAGSAPDLGCFETGLSSSGAGGAGGAGGSAGTGTSGAAGSGTSGTGNGSAGAAGGGTSGAAGAGTSGTGNGSAGAAGMGTAGVGTSGAAGAGSSGAAGVAGAAGNGNGSAGVSNGGTGGDIGTAGASTSGGSTGVAGTGAGVAGTGTGVAGTGAGVAGTGTGVAGTGAGVAGSGTGVAGATSSGGAIGNGGDGEVTSPGGTAANQPGCSCRVAGGQGRSASLGLLPLLALLGLGRRKRRG